MFRCPYCGSEIRGNTNYCTNCGRNIKESRNYKSPQRNYNDSYEDSYDYDSKQSNKRLITMFTIAGVAIIAVTGGVLFYLNNKAKAENADFTKSIVEEAAKDSLYDDVTGEDGSSDSDAQNDKDSADKSKSEPSQIVINNENVVQNSNSGGDSASYSQSTSGSLSSSGSSSGSSSSSSSGGYDTSGLTSYYLGQDVYLRSSPNMDSKSNIMHKVYKGDVIYDLGEDPVRDEDADGRERLWIKVVTSSGDVGYVSNRAINMTDRKPYQ